MKAFGWFSLIVILLIPGVVWAGEKGKLVSILADYADLKEKVQSIQSARKEGYSSDSKEMFSLIREIKAAIKDVQAYHDQAYGKRAKQATSALVFGKEVRLQTFGKDKYGRSIADVFLPHGTNVNYELVKAGWCWWYRKYAPGDAELEKFEKDARDAKRGLWVDPAPVHPWVYRKAQRGQSLDRSDIVPFDSRVSDTASSRGPPQLEVLEPEASSYSSIYPIVGNRRSHIYHRPDCPNYSQIAPKNRVRFNTPAQAEEAGYRLAGNCPVN